MIEFIQALFDTVGVGGCASANVAIESLGFIPTLFDRGGACDTGKNTKATYPTPMGTNQDNGAHEHNKNIFNKKLSEGRPWHLPVYFTKFYSNIWFVAQACVDWDVR